MYRLLFRIARFAGGRTPAVRALALCTPRVAVGHRVHAHLFAASFGSGWCICYGAWPPRDRMCCSLSQHVAACCSLMYGIMHMLWGIPPPCCNVLQCVAVCCSVMYCKCVVWSAIPKKYRCTYTYVSICIYMYTCIHMNICIIYYLRPKDTWMYIRAFFEMYICQYKCIYVYMHIYMQI